MMYYKMMYESPLGSMILAASDTVLVGAWFEGQKYCYGSLQGEVMREADTPIDIFVRIGSSYNITLEEWNHDQAYVHVMFRAHPNTEMSKFINAYKSASSRLIKKDFPEVRRKL